MFVASMRSPRTRRGFLALLDSASRLFVCCLFFGCWKLASVGQPFVEMYKHMGTIHILLLVSLYFSASLLSIPPRLSPLSL